MQQNIEVEVSEAHVSTNTYLHNTLRTSDHEKYGIAGY